jgi:hypothetical protein
MGVLPDPKLAARVGADLVSLAIDVPLDGNVDGEPGGRSDDEPAQQEMGELQHVPPEAGDELQLYCGDLNANGRAEDLPCQNIELNAVLTVAFHLLSSANLCILCVAL